MCFMPQRRGLFPHLNVKKWSENGAFFLTFWLGNVLRATTACTFSTSQLPKVVREWCVLYILTWKCDSRHNGVHFSHISTSKSGPIMVCLVHFDLEMWFAPQRRALFPHLNFQKWSENGASSNILTWKCDSRHNGVHFFDISTSKSGPRMVCLVHFDLEMWFAPQRRALFRRLDFKNLLRTRCAFSFLLQNVLRATTACNFSSLIWRHGSAPAALARLLFDPPEPQIIGKHTVNRDFPTFSRTCIFFLLTFSLLWSSHFFSSPLRLFPPLLFQLSILSEVSLQNFLRQYKQYLKIQPD